MFKSLIRMLANPVGISHGALKRVLKNGSYLVLSSMCSRIWRSYGVNWKTILMAVVIVLALGDVYARADNGHVDGWRG